MKTNLVQQIEAQQIKSWPSFQTGDTVVVSVKVKEAERERIQLFEGVIIAKRRMKSLQSAFIVRKISHGIGVERTFQTHSPLIANIQVKRRGAVRKAKLYYLRQLHGRAARIKEAIKRKEHI